MWYLTHGKYAVVFDEQKHKWLRVSSSGPHLFSPCSVCPAFTCTDSCWWAACSQVLLHLSMLGYFQARSKGKWVSDSWVGGRGDYPETCWLSCLGLFWAKNQWAGVWMNRWSWNLRGPGSPGSMLPSFRSTQPSAAQGMPCKHDPVSLEN